MSMIGWSNPDPRLPSDTHPVLAEATRAAGTAFRAARTAHSRARLAETGAVGADGTAAMRLDLLVEEPVAEVAAQHGLNLLSEEIGFVDRGSATTLVVDPVDGTANAAAGVPLSAFAATLVRDRTAVESLTCWFDTGRCWSARRGERSPHRTSGRTELDGAAVDLLRPHERTADAWWRVARRAGRIRVLSTSCLEAALVAEGSVDAFLDAASDTHRIVDLAAALVALPAAGGALLDLHGRDLDFDPDLTRRWSGIAAATPQLAEQLAETARG
ncbi:inositol monophosphatase [Saccharopolyspora sp. HNM0983]|uniref:Inositol monophosphatase n=1 Tax=Saccharopolyspora montiporae TaxID=2781240 RepID=A0A929BAZ3_9PSEU|nr:inositol monophosphatase family protein [Saccharopolyspora sp. HNM0983]MBE9376532.1 inositol monophosphatase [Saccharopolyspora sp. HNM0983]